MGHRVGLAAQIHDRVRDAAGDVDEGQIAELAIGAIETRRELGGQLENQSRALGGDLPKARIGHFGKLGLLAGAHPGAAGRLFVEQSHFAEELAFVEVGEHHLVAVLVLDHDLDRAAR